MHLPQLISVTIYEEIDWYRDKENKGEDIYLVGCELGEDDGIELGRL